MVRPPQYRHLFSKGIHLVVDRITDNKRVLTFFASDGRLFFLIPMGSRTCIGTTDTQVDSPEVAVTDEDRDFVLANANALLDLDPPLTRASIIAERVGVRPLAMKGQGGVADWVALSRKHVIEVDEAAAAPEHLRRQAHRLPQRGRRGRGRMCAGWASNRPPPITAGTANRARICALNSCCRRA